MRRDNEHKKYLESPELKQKFLLICSKFGKAQYFEDVFHSYCVGILEGKGSHQTLEQFFIDYSRKEKWISRGDNELPKFTELLDQTSAKAIENDFFMLIESLACRERAMIILYFKYGLYGDEIGKIYRVSAKTVSTMISKALKKLSEGVEL